MRNTPERDLAVAQELGSMADARIRELETRLREVEAERDGKFAQNTDGL